MTNSEKFINWLEGYLDACKNTLDSNQVKVIRKKLKDCSFQSTTTPFTYPPLIPIYDDRNQTLSHSTYVADQEFLKEIEKNKNASTMEDLQENRLFETIEEDHY